MFRDIDVRMHALAWSFASPAEAAAFLFANSAPHIAALRSLPAGDAEGLVLDVASLAASMSQSVDPVQLEVEYAVVTATAR
jgi:hypothetical protein